MNGMKKWDKKLTALQGYNAMRRFLTGFRPYYDDVFDLCQRLKLLKNGITADPVVSHKWAWCVHEALGSVDFSS